MKKILVLLFWALPISLLSQPTFVTSLSSPADNGTNTSVSLTVPWTSLTGITTGDLVIMCIWQRGTATASITNAGNQTWNSIGNDQGTSNVSLSTYWCEFNGTTTNDAEFTLSAGTNTNKMVLVFRPTDASTTWQTEQIATTNAAAATTITVTGVTPGHNNTVTTAAWYTADDNTWGNLTGTGWSKTSLPAQIRNTSGQDMSGTWAYRLLGTAAATNNVSQDQLTLGADATTWRRITFYEQATITRNAASDFFKIFNKK